MTLLLVVVPLGADGQSLPAGASLQVMVTDAQRLPVPGARVTLVAGGRALVVHVTGDDGSAAFDAAAGIYTVSVERAGFLPFVQTDLTLTTGQRATVDVPLKDAGISEHVTVKPEDTTDATLARRRADAPVRVERRDVQRVPIATATLRDVLPLVPNVVRSATGELSFKGAPEQHAGLLINGMNAADPATGEFHLDLPVDSVEAVQVFLHPYAAEFGHFASAVTTVETRAGGDMWHFEVNDFLPDLRFVKGSIHGIAEDSPHLNISGPMFGRRVFLSQSGAYTFANRPVRGLAYPDNETRTQNVSSYSQLDIASHPRHAQRVTFSFFDQRNDYVGLDVFRPRPVTPTTLQRDASLAVRDNSQIAGGLLSISASVHEYRFTTRPRGDLDQVLTPSIEQGNYFARSDRRSARGELFAVYTAPAWTFFGRHELRIGADVNVADNALDYQAGPVNVVRADGTLVRRVEFDSVAPIRASNREYVGFLQDRWEPRSNLSIDAGVRYEDQRIADAETLLAPRVGVTWVPRKVPSMTVRGGVGLFYGTVPLNVRSFAGYPARTVTTFDLDGETPLARVRYRNILIDANASPDVPRTPGSEKTEYVPQSLSANAQVEREFAPWLVTRANVITSQTTSVYVVTQRILPSGRAANLLSSTGRSDYRAFELMARVGPAPRAVNVSYTRSRALGDLNEFSSVVGDVASPLIRPNQYSRQPLDAPNRFMAWGAVALPRKVSVSPLVEVRSGFPYSSLDEAQNFVGVRNDDRTRFPRFFSLDMELSKDVAIRSHAVRLSVRAFNLTNHFNPRDVYANIADPRYGQFLASYRRYFAGGFDVLF